ncbi:magnesium transporter [Roseiflexus castenholzii]|jgi:magnesium transporter|uniref:Magnesium transporter MgtE n=1 Tax=Roseiflexus castenholzii (strain DSM 13941 / HLO8) TaxID=383372 RepID=A7NM45_ROSCS|nr:magnesium transporter [Roseiflexus castenholzii]ABU58600.1 magnesium transporter [Roseiflexus castenholzii DSM 13941]
MTAPLDLDLLEQQVRAALETEDITTLRELVARIYPPDLADIIERLDDEDQQRVFSLLELSQAADVLDEASIDTARELIGQMPVEQAADILEELDSDDAAAILTEDVPERQNELLAAMAPEEAADVRELLRYPPQSAGRLLNDRFVALRESDTVADAMERLRNIVHDAAVIVYLYVLDQHDRLIGTVSLRRLLVDSPNRPIIELMRPSPLAVQPETDQEEVARMVARYDLAALPVVDGEGRMLGVVTVDDVMDVLLEEGTEDVLKFGAVAQGQADETYFTTPIVASVRRRIVWLLFLFVAGSITANVLRLFETELEQVVALSFFIPLLIGTGGNTGAQTVSTLIRAMALNEVRLRDVWRVLVRELLVGIILGVLLAIIAFGRAFLEVPMASLAITVALSVMAICIWANIIGAMVPMAARRVGIDPALISAPLITTLVDASGLAIYLLIAKLLLGL